MIPLHLLTRDYDGNHSNGTVDFPSIPLGQDNSAPEGLSQIIWPTPIRIQSSYLILENLKPRIQTEKKTALLSKLALTHR